MKKERQSGIELLRIIAMLAIVLHHLILYVSNGEINHTLGSFSSALEAGLCSFGKTGVAIFFLITGYFLCASKKMPEPKRALPIVRLAVFYLLVALGLVLVMNPNLLPLSFPPAGIWRGFTDVFTAGDYWFIGAYALLWLIAPQLKKMLDALSDKDLTKLCLVIAITVTVASEIMRLGRIGDGVTVFLFPSAFTYALIGYTIRRREHEIKSSGWAVVAIMVGVFLVMITPLISSYYYSHGWGDITGIFSRDQATGTMLTAVGLLVVFSRMKWQSRVINYIAKLTLAVYLIHNSPFVVEGVFRNNLFNTEWLHTLLFERGVVIGLAATLGVSLAIFAACCIIEVIRRFAVRIIAKICTAGK